MSGVWRRYASSQQTTHSLSVRPGEARMPRGSKKFIKGRYLVEIDMKFALKSMVAAVAFVAAGVSSAASVTAVADGTTVTQGYTVTGSGMLEFSKNLAGALKLGGVTIGAYGGASSAAKTITTTVNGKTTSYVTYDITAPIQSLTFDTATGNKITEAVSVGGATQAMAQNDTIAAVGGNAQVGDLDVKFNADGSAAIYGKIVGAALDGTAVNFNGLLFNVTAANISGATAFPGTAGTYTTTLNSLAITTDGFNALATVFGLDPTGLGYTSLQSAASNFGVLTSTITATAVAAVPEPSTYALMGLGLVGMGLVSRRRAK